jgi:hypothetical protein
VELENAQTELVMDSIVAEFRHLAELGAAGRPIDLDRLRHLLDLRPQIWRRYLDLAGLIQNSLAENLTGSDVVACETLSRAVVAKREEIVAGSTSPLERLLADQIVTHWLHAQQAELMAIGAADLPAKERKFRIAHRERTQRQLQRAIVELARVRKMLPPAATPPRPAFKPAGRGRPPRNDQRTDVGRRTG